MSQRGKNHITSGIRTPDLSLLWRTPLTTRPARRCMLEISYSGGWFSSVGGVLGSLSCVMKHPRFPPSSEPLIDRTLPLELTWVLTPFPKTLSDESINLRLVCAHMHSIAWTKKSWVNASNEKHNPACTIHEDSM